MTDRDGSATMSRQGRSTTTGPGHVGGSHVMPIVDEAVFRERWCRRSLGGPEASPEVEQRVSEIVRAVRERKDQALVELTRQLDGVDLAGLGVELSPEELARGAALADPEAVEAIRACAESIREYHRTVPQPRLVERDGFVCGRIPRPLDRVGVYVPGGRAAYPSTVLMTAIPAVMAGVAEVIVCTPPRPPTLLPHPATLAACAEAGVRRVFRVGGAQAVAAMAYGTESVPRVDKIVGPGNAYVTTAKRMVFGAVGIDGLAGPSEVVVVADGAASPVFVALDLLAQAEHDPDAGCVAIVTDSGLAERLVSELALRLPNNPAAEPAVRRGCVVVVPDVARAVELANAYAPEHLELHVSSPGSVLPLVKAAGCVFLGAGCPEAIGDYVAGPSHVLPTGGSARFSSGLGVDSFVRWVNVVSCSAQALASAGPHAAVMARCEGLGGHGASIEERLKAGKAG